MTCTVINRGFRQCSVTDLTVSYLCVFQCSALTFSARRQPGGRDTPTSSRAEDQASSSPGSQPRIGQTGHPQI